MKPIIGITSSIRDGNLLSTSLDNVHALSKAGGIPVVLPNIADPESLDKLVNSLDGLLITGGGDIDPTMYGEEPHPNLGEVIPERDRFEVEIAARFLERDKPILGLCRGCQIINVSAGGSLYQDIYTQHEGQLLQHSQKAARYHLSHWVEVSENSKLHGIICEARLKTNSFHHQAVKRIADGFEIVARASDGIVEAIESVQHRFAIGVQWHPENLIRADDLYSLRLFETFVCASKIR